MEDCSFCTKSTGMLAVTVFQLSHCYRQHEGKKRIPRGQ